MKLQVLYTEGGRIIATSEIGSRFNRAKQQLSATTPLRSASTTTRRWLRPRQLPS